MRFLICLCLCLIWPKVVSAQNVSEQKINEAANKACQLDVLRTRWSGGVILDRPDDERINTVWLKRFNEFSSSPDAFSLLDYAEELNRANVGRHRDAQCYRVVPAYGLAVTAINLRHAKGSVVPGHLLRRCGDTFCLPPALEAVQQTCEVNLSSKNYADGCYGLIDPELGFVLPKRLP